MTRAEAGASVPRTRWMLAAAIILLLQLCGPLAHLHHMVEEAHHHDRLGVTAALHDGVPGWQDSTRDGHDPHHASDHDLADARAGRCHAGCDAPSAHPVAAVGAVEPASEAPGRTVESAAPDRRSRCDARPHAPRGPPVS